MLAATIVFSGMPNVQAMTLSISEPVVTREIPNTIFAPENAMSAEEALIRVKRLVSIPQEMDAMRSNYYEDLNRKIWSFSWTSSKQYIGELSVQIDVVSGDIINYYIYSEKYPAATSQSYLPKISWEQGRTVASDVIRRFTNKQSHEYVLANKEQFVLQKGAKSHYYTFEQVINGVPVKGQTIGISINADTGELMNYHSQWIPNFPKEEKAMVSKDEALETFKKANGMELAYLLRPYDAMRKEVPRVQLVYRPVKVHEFAVDATTGEMFQQNQYYGYESPQMTKEATRDSRLEDFEKVELEKLANLISQDQALQIAQKITSIPDSLKLTYISMQQNWEFPENRHWDMRWEKNEQDGERHYYESVEIAIHAKTGKLVRYGKYNNQMETEKVDEKDFKVQSEQQAIEIAKAYIALHYPEYLDSLQLRTDAYNKILDAQGKPNNYNLHFQRMVNGIPFDSNYIMVNVQAATGEVQHFNCSWYDIDFPKVENVITKENALNQFLSDNTFELNYNKYYDYKFQTPQSKLVYSFTQLDNMIYDAHTGKALDYQGKEKLDTKKEFKDLTNHWVENDVEFLQKYGLIFVDEDEFKPSQAITQGEFIKMLLKIERPYLAQFSVRDVELYAAERSFILPVQTRQWDDKTTISREDMAQILVQFLNYHEVAALDIFTSNFKDDASIAKDRQGAVAILHGMKIMSGADGMFMPKKLTTRAEAAATIVKLLKR